MRARSPCKERGRGREKGFSLEKVSRAVERIKRYRGTEQPFDVVYGFEFPEDRHLLNETIQKAASVGVTWMLEGIYGLRYSPAQALDRIKNGPPNTG